MGTENIHQLLRKSIWIYGFERMNEWIPFTKALTRMHPTIIDNSFIIPSDSPWIISEHETTYLQLSRIYKLALIPMTVKHFTSTYWNINLTNNFTITIGNYIESGKLN